MPPAWPVPSEKIMIFFDTVNCLNGDTKCSKLKYGHHSKTPTLPLIDRATIDAFLRPDSDQQISHPSANLAGLTSSWAGR
jgi:hypothetical protein